MTAKWVDRPRYKSESYGLPMGCEKEECGYRWLKLPGVKMPSGCPNCGERLVSLRPKRPRA